MTLEISAARMSIFSLSSKPCGLQPFMTWARLFNLVRMEPSIMRLPIWTMSPPRMAGSTLEIDRDVGGRAGRADWSLSASTWPSSSGRAEVTSAVDLAAMAGGEQVEGADHVAELAEPAVLREHAEEIGGDRIELHRRRARRRPPAPRRRGRPAGWWSACGNRPIRQAPASARRGSSPTASSCLRSSRASSNRAIA